MVGRALLLSLALCGACSFIGVTSVGSGGVNDCTASNSAPTRDVVVFVVAAVALTASAIGYDRCNPDTPISCTRFKLGALASAAVMVPYGISAGWGFGAVGDCRAARANPPADAGVDRPVVESDRY